MKLDKVIAVRSNKTVYRDGDVCMKVFNEGFSTSDILNEALNQARVEETGLNIPRIREVTVVDGKWSIVSDYIEGKTLAQLMQENPEKKDEYINLLVDLQIEIQSKSSPLLTRLRDKLSRKISQTDFDATTRYDLYTRLDKMPKHNKLCHGDFNPSNIIITNDGTPYIIDWSHATQGNASADACITYMLLQLSGDVPASYRYLELFCEKSGNEKSYVQKWLPIVAASQTVNCKDSERNFLLKLVNEAE